MKVPKTSLRARKNKFSQKYVSETTLCPDQQILHDELRMVLGPNKSRPIIS